MVIKKQQLFAFAAFATLATAVASMPAKAASTIDMGADGAVSVNAQWEAGTSKAWYIELQRDGGSLIRTGIAQENDAMIRQGLQAFDWGFQKEAADGSYPGTGDPFHSTSLFVCGVAQAVDILKTYQPRTYQLDQTFYANKIATYVDNLHRSALWLVWKGPMPDGKKNDAPYTHRRYILAETLADVGALTGDASLGAAAIPYVQDGLSLQLPNGVNPEQGGYDVNYQCAGILQAEKYYHLCPDRQIRSQLLQMIYKGLVWESGFVDVNGNVSIGNSTREGIETNRDDTIKTPDITDIRDCFTSGGLLTNTPEFLIVNQRMIARGSIPSNAVVAADGSIGDNTTWEKGKLASWNVSTQKVGADWIQAGIQRESDSMIREGVAIISWGIAHQAADGSFPACSSAYPNTAFFTEATAHAASMLANYNPSTYTADQSFFNNAAKKFKTSALNSSNWLLTPDAIAKGVKSDAGCSSHQFVVAAALAETAALTGNTTLQTAATSQLLSALTVITPQGVVPQAGVFDVSQQGVAMLYLARVGEATNDPTLNAKIASALWAGMSIENNYVTPAGKIVGSASPLTTSIQSAYAEAYPLTLRRILLIIHNRLTNRTDLN